MDAGSCSFYGRWLRSQNLNHDDYSVNASASDMRFMARRTRKGCSEIHLDSPGTFCNVPHYKESYPFIGYEEDAIHEETVISDKHTVSMYFREGKLSNEKLVSLSTLHKYHDDDVLALNYSTDLKGGGDFDMNILHYFGSNSTFSTRFWLGSYCDPMLEFKSDQQKDRKRVSRRLLANLKTGEKHLCLESKNAMGGILTKKTFTTNTKDQHTSRLEMDIPFSSSFHILQSVATDFKKGMDFSINLSKSICKCNFMSASLSTNFWEVNCISVEAKHEVNKHRDASLKLTNDLQGGKQLTISMSAMKGNNRFACNFRRALVADCELPISRDLESLTISRSPREDVVVQCKLFCIFMLVLLDIVRVAILHSVQLCNVYDEIKLAIVVAVEIIIETLGAESHEQ